MLKKSPVAAAWIAGVLIWGAAMAGLGIMDTLASGGDAQWMDRTDPAAEFERAFGGNNDEPADRPDPDPIRPVASPDS